MKAYSGLEGKIPKLDSWEQEMFSVSKRKIKKVKRKDVRIKTLQEDIKYLRKLSVKETNGINKLRKKIRRRI